MIYLRYMICNHLVLFYISQKRSLCLPWLDSEHISNFLRNQAPVQLVVQISHVIDLRNMLKLTFAVFPSVRNIDCYLT